MTLQSIPLDTALLSPATLHFTQNKSQSFRVISVPVWNDTHILSDPIHLLFPLPSFFLIYPLWALSTDCSFFLASPFSCTAHLPSFPSLCSDVAFLTILYDISFHPQDYVLLACFIFFSFSIILNLFLMRYETCLFSLLYLETSIFHNWLLPHVLIAAILRIFLPKPLSI